MPRSLVPLLFATLGGLALSCGGKAPPPADPAPGVAAAPATAELPPGEVPGPAAGAVRALFPGAAFESAVREDGKDGVRYTITLTPADGAAREVTVTETGSVVEVAKEMAFADLPGPVAEQVRQRRLKAEIGDVAELTAPGQPGTRYHVELKTAAGAAVALTFDPDGKLIESE